MRNRQEFLDRETRENLKDKQKELYREKVSDEADKAAHPETTRTFTQNYNYMNPNTKTYV
jgi:hypothetical protein